MVSIHQLASWVFSRVQVVDKQKYGVRNTTESSSTSSNIRSRVHGVARAKKQNLVKKYQNARLAVSLWVFGVDINIFRSTEPILSES